jgi:hypothetical protein
MSWKECARKGSLSLSKYHVDYLLEGLGKPTRLPNASFRCPGQNSAHASPKCESRALSLKLICSAIWDMMCIYRVTFIFARKVDNIREQVMVVLSRIQGRN